MVYHFINSLMSKICKTDVNVNNTNTNNIDEIIKVTKITLEIVNNMIIYITIILLPLVCILVYSLWFLPSYKTKDLEDLLDKIRKVGCCLLGILSVFINYSIYARFVIRQLENRIISNNIKV